MWSWGHFWPPNVRQLQGLQQRDCWEQADRVMRITCVQLGGKRKNSFDRLCLGITNISATFLQWGSCFGLLCCRVQCTCSSKVVYARLWLWINSKSTENWRDYSTYRTPGGSLSVWHYDCFPVPSSLFVFRSSCVAVFSVWALLLFWWHKLNEKHSSWKHVKAFCDTISGLLSAGNGVNMFWECSQLEKISNTEPKPLPVWNPELLMQVGV